MNNVFIAVESLAALIILILIFANVYEMKENSAKKSLFTRLLIANEIVVVVDVITWLKFDWRKYPLLLSALIAVTYITPAVMQILFSLYIYEHISLKAEVNKKPFNFIVYFSAVEGIATAVLCLTGNLFTIQDGKFYEGPLGHFYYLLNILNVILLVSLIVFNSRKLSPHDMMAALTFCVVPVVSIMTTVVTGLNFSITLLSVSMLIMYVMLQSEYESLLFRRANVDELTGLLNRAAYEDEVTKYQDLRQYPNLVYASVDVNGLKRVNDTLGHVAGDELICGAADCLKGVFGKYGKVFRTGGDEFVSIFFADEGQLTAVIEEFESTVQGWKGNLVDSLTVSLGLAAPAEFPDEPLVELAKIADSRMYDSKRNFYSSAGMDRRSQNDAHR
ncbi:MAG: GGDEF domain-containing protein, partial [Clostridiales bacterium]|nr:GGDEF domain-containing protein [Candidatus Blautia equi]